MSRSHTWLQSHELHYNLGWIWQQQARLKQASESYRKSILLGRQLVEGSKGSAALAAQTDFAHAHHNLGMVLAEQGQWQAAIYYARRAITLQPDLVPAYCNLGMVLFQQGKTQRAIQVYHQAIALRQQGIFASDLVWASLYYNLGQALQYKAEVTEAIAAYTEAIVLAPDNAQISYCLGTALHQQGDYCQAVSAFQRALCLDATRLDIEADCGFSWLSLGELDQAMRCFQRSIAPDLPLIIAYCQGASIRQDSATTDEMTQAKLAFSRFLVALQTYPEVPSNYLCEYPSDQQIQQGIQQSIQQDLVQSLFHWSNVLTQYGGRLQLQQAAIHYQQAIELQPDRIELYLRLADCLMQQGQIDRAMAVYDQLELRLTQVIGSPLGVKAEFPEQPRAEFPEPPTFLPKVIQLLEQSQQWQQAIAYYRWSLKLGQPLAPLKAGVRLPQRMVSHHWIQDSEDETITGAAITDGLEASRVDESTTSSPDQLRKGIPQHSAKLYSQKLCEGLNCHPCLKRITHWFDPLSLAPGIVRLSAAADSLPPATFPNRSVIRIPNGRTWAASKANIWQVCNAIAVFTATGEILPQFSRDYPGELPGCQYPSPLARVPLSVNLDAPKQISGKVAVLTGLSGDVYFHWMVDILPRLEILRQNGIDLEEIDWFLVNSQEKAFQQETLQAFGIPLERVIESDRYPYIQAEELIVPAFAGDLGWVQPWAIARLRDQFLSNIDLNFRQKPGHKQYSSNNTCIPGQSRQYGVEKLLQDRSDCHSSSFQHPTDHPSNRHRRIYLSRSDAEYRRVLNEAAIINLILSFGFEVLTLDRLSVVEQASIFAQAAVIIAPHGSSLTNLIFCDRGTKVLEFVSPNYVRHYYWPISQALELEHYVVWGQEFSCTALRQLMYPSALMEDIWVDLDRLKQAIELIL